MSEFQPKFEDSKEKHIDSREFAAINKEAAERRERAAEAVEARQDSIEVIKERLEKAVDGKEKQAHAHKEKPAAESVSHVGKSTKDHYYKQTLKRTQKKLPATQRTFSKVIHQPVVEALSDVGGATVARPSGLLVGGLFSVISSLTILYICRHYGYEYNFLVGLASFAGGFAVGLLFEGTAKLVRR